MKRFFIITNRDKDPSLEMTKRIQGILKAGGASAEYWVCEGRREGSWHYVDPAVVPEDTECLVVLGGDGTLLQAARDMVLRGLPLVGVNLGHLGFMAEVDRYGITGALRKLLEDQYEIEERMMLQGQVVREGKVIGEDLALNDIVITREGRIRVIQFDNYVNGEYLNSYNADGVIVSTATGSTGYSLSVGGPMVAPNAKLLLLSALAPHTLNSRTIVFPPQDVITVVIGAGRHGVEETCVASFDGDTQVQMRSGDRVEISRALVSVRIVKLSHLSFVEALRQKLAVTV